MINAKARVSPVTVSRFETGASGSVDDLVAVEEPLQVRLQFIRGKEWVEEPLTVTMRTPGNDFELAAGFLFAENIIDGAGDILRIRYCRKVKEREQGNVVVVRLVPRINYDEKRLERNFFMNSSCGVCGKSAIDAISCKSEALDAKNEPAVSTGLIRELNDKLEQQQTVFRHTGGLHASALFDFEGKCHIIREDIGRHNALDKAIGAAMASSKIRLDASLAFLSGRVSYELVQKAVRAGIPIIVAVGAPSSLAVELAGSKGMTLVGFLRGDRFNVYTHPGRIVDL